MTALIWDTIGSRFYETGVDKGVLYVPDAVTGLYDTGYAWNGLTAVTESPTGAEANPMYADNLKYLNLYSLEEFGATIEAYTYPDQWNQFDGLVTPKTGVTVGQQPRKLFGLSYQTRVGNDVNDDLGYKIHLMYGCKASPSEKAYATINDSPSPITFSWSVNTTPVASAGRKATSLLTIDSTKVSSANLAALEVLLYGTTGVNPALPSPDAVIALFDVSLQTVSASQLQTAAPTFNGTTGAITITTLAGIVWTNAVTGAVVTAGSPPANVTTGNTTVIRATAATGYTIAPLAQTIWSFSKA